MSKTVIKRYIVADKTLGVATASRAVFIEKADGFYGLNPLFKPNQILIYDYATGVTVGPGVTVDTVPKLVIAQAIDADGDGIVDTLRKPAGDFIDGFNLSAVTADPPSCGQIKILDIGIPCGLETETSYTLTIEARTDHTEGHYKYNDFERWTETFVIPKTTCTTDCDNTAECTQVACGIANRFNAKDYNNSYKKQPAILNRIQKYQKDEKPFHVYPLLANDYEFCFASSSSTCASCNRIGSIGGIIIDGVTTQFNYTAVDTDYVSVNEVDNIVNQINKAFGENSTGYAVNASTFIGSAKPCCDGVKILINSCKTVSLLDGDLDPITPCATGLPTHEITIKGQCQGCDDATTITPSCFLRVVPKPIRIEKYAETPDSYKKTLYTDIRATTSYWNDNFGSLYLFTKQDYTLPQNIGYQLLHDVVSQDTSANAPDVWGWNERNSDTYGTLHQKSRVVGMTKGMLENVTEGFCVINFEHSRANKDQISHGHLNSFRLTTTLLLPNSNSTIKTDVEAIINPWIVSAKGHVFKTVTCASDQDQTERTLNANTSVNQAEYPNANGQVL